MMRVSIREFGHSGFYKCQATSEESPKSQLRRPYFYGARGSGKTNFMIASTVIGSFRAPEIERWAKQVSVRQNKWFVAVPIASQEPSVENRLKRLEENFNGLVKSTWGYLFTKRDIREMDELSKGMLEGSKKMRELAEKLQEVEDED